MKSSGGRRRLLLTLLLGAPGYMGIGIAKGESMFDTMNLVQRRARLNLFPVKRGCGAWSCGCGNTEHTIPYKVRGRAGSVTIDLIPAPRGSGLAIGPVGQKILSLVGIKDIASKSSGHTRTTKNYALAVAAALKKLRELCLSRVDRACIQNIQRQAEEDLTDDAEKLLNEQRTVEMPEESHDE
jgi:small subunit ribosomal protein S5